MKKLLALLFLPFLAFGQPPPPTTGGLTVQNNNGGTPGLITAPVSAAVFKSANGIGDLTNPMTTLGDTIYGAASGVPTRLAGNTTATKLFSTQTGTGAVSAVPAWAAIVNGDIPSALTGKTYNGLTLTTTTGTLTIPNSASLITSGAFAATFTFTGTTGVTFPTSGTLATVAGTVSSITGTANEIAASASTGAVTLSLPSTLTFTSKTITGGTYASGAFNGTLGATTPSTVAASTITSSGAYTFTGGNSITAAASSDLLLRAGSSGVIETLGNGANGSYSVALGSVQLSRINNSTSAYTTAFGYGAANALPSGNFNTAFGYNALNVVSTGTENTAIGPVALQRTTIGTNNVGVGSDTLPFNVSGNFNTAVGWGALFTNVSGNYNTAYGQSALAVSIGSNNVALGSFAGSYETGGNSFYVDALDRANTAGDKAGALLYGTFNATAASQTLKVNAAVTIAQGLTVAGAILGSGGTAPNSSNSGSNQFTAGIATGGPIYSGGDAFINGVRAGPTGGATSVVIGPGNAALNSTGANVTAIGYAAGAALTNGSSNTLIGRGAGSGLTTSIQNTAIGHGALVGVSTATGLNTAVGYSALNATSGSGNVAVGAFAGNHDDSSNSFFVNNQDRTDQAGDRAKSLLYGTFNATAASQQLTINAGTVTTLGAITMSGTLTGAATLTGTNSINSAASTALTLGTASFGTSVSIASATGIPTFNTTINATSISVGGSAVTMTAANSVSPTSPNRTITITYGGTTYYLAAKTTND